MGKQRISQIPTLCWTCQHCVPDPNNDLGCPWFIDGKPTPGWEAIQEEIIVGEKRLKTYKVLSCPMYLKDKPNKKINKTP